MKNITLKESVNITNNFSALRTKKNWGRLEQIVIYALSKKIQNDLSQLKKIEFINMNISDIDVSKISRSIDLDRETLISMGFNKDKFSREIKDVSISLLDKKIITTHPDRVKCSDSFGMSNWFNSFFYNKQTGIVNIEINENALKLLKYFYKYSSVDPNHMVNLKSDYSFNIYLVSKVDIDSSKGMCTKYEISLADFRDSFGLNDKYRSIHMLRKKILDLIVSNINDYTDLSMDYELIKEGRSYTKIKFIFDYKAEVIEHKKINKVRVKKKEPYLLEDVTTNEYIDDSSPFEQTLVGWGIRAKKVVEIEDIYSLEVLSQSIDETIKAETDGKIKTTKAAFFVGVLANKQKSDDEIFERQLNESRKKEEKTIKESESAEKEIQYNAIQNDIHLYEEDLSRYLSAKSVGGNVDVSKEAIDFIETVSNVDKEIFKGYKSKFAVLDNGYINVKTGKNIRPNIYDFLCLIHDM